MHVKNCARLGILVVMLAAMLCTSYAAETILGISLQVSRDDEVSGEARMSLGSPSEYRNESGDYRLAILDVTGEAMWSRNYDLQFYVLTDPGRMSDYELIDERIAYAPEMYEIRMYHNSRVIYRSALDFCDANGICDEGENSISCPSDCYAGAPDGICVNAGDGVCDPDCIAGIDIDCRERESKKGAARILLAVAALMLIVLAIAAAKEGKKIKPWISKAKAYLAPAAKRLKLKERAEKVKKKLREDKEDAGKIGRALKSYIK